MQTKLQCDTASIERVCFACGPLLVRGRFYGTADFIFPLSLYVLLILRCGWPALSVIATPHFKWRLSTHSLIAIGYLCQPTYKKQKPYQGVFFSLSQSILTHLVITYKLTQKSLEKFATKTGSDDAQPIRIFFQNMHTSAVSAIAA